MTQINKSRNVLIALSSTKVLGQKIADKLNMPLADVDIKHFADGETMVRSNVSLRGKHLYVIQSTCKPVNENLMELLVAVDSFKRASARSITCIIPYFGYSRQDRKSASREPITCKLAADIIQVAGATRVVIVDLHAEQTQGFFNIPVDTISASYAILAKMVKDHGVRNTIIVSPDYGSVKRARKLAKFLNLPIAILDKRRPKPNVAEICNVLGEIKGKNCIIVDDMIDTGGTLVAACEVLKKKGAKKVIAGATHGLFNGQAVEKLNKALKQNIITDLYVTNTMDSVYKCGIKNLKVLDLSKMIAGIIDVYVSKGQKTITDLFETTKLIF